MPPIDPALALVCEQLSIATGLPVSVGTASTADGLVLWPWRLVAGDRSLTAPIRGPGGERSTPQALRVKLSVAVLASSGTAPLRLALAWATDNAVLSIGERRLILRQQSMDVPDLTALFLAGGVPLAPALFWEFEDWSDAA
jgi:hypothetical protein